MLHIHLMTEWENLQVHFDFCFTIVHFHGESILRVKDVLQMMLQKEAFQT